MAIYLKKCCFFLSLRTGIILLAIFLICQGMGAVIYSAFSDLNLCLRLLTLWFLAAGFNIMTGFFLFIATFRDRHRILPVAIVLKLTGLIIEMFFHLFIASTGFVAQNFVIYSMFSICVTIFSVTMIFSYFQQEESDG